MQDLYQEVDALMTKIGVGMHKIKPCSRKYAFELPDIPKEADYLKLMYPYDSEYHIPFVILSNTPKNLRFQLITKGRHTAISLVPIQLCSSNLCCGRTSWDPAG